eukprot:CAMPEP_0171879672 /NCGR_PEP_ID=MMETSP0992-20121227/38003_1 /TAXON_ID=483369 /ORGANISM="non described non described, Strain CCMP2098" /LENGTH=36 /DNA_ID= /DNA_START= /DNA_END= /DNA_ORIENTATION=
MAPSPTADTTTIDFIFSAAAPGSNVFLSSVRLALRW